MVELPLAAASRHLSMTVVTARYWRPAQRVSSVVANYNRFPLTSNFSVVSGTTYYVGYVTSMRGASASRRPVVFGGWYVPSGQSVASPANPLVGGASNAQTLMCALELDEPQRQVSVTGWTRLLVSHYQHPIHSQPALLLPACWHEVLSRMSRAMESSMPRLSLAEQLIPP